MPNPIRTTIGQFSSVGGRPQPRAANVRAVEPAPGLPGAERGNLYIFLEVSGSGGGHAALYRQVLNATQTAFYEAEGTLSSALVRAVRSAHATLRRANEVLPEAGWRAGITCAALQGHDLLVAQAGPALVLVGHLKTIDQFPAGSQEFTAPLGGEERPEVELVRTQVEPGSMILLAQSDWLRHVPPEALAAATAADDVGPVIEYLGQLAEGAELSALVIAISSPPSAQQGRAPQSSARSAGWLTEKPSASSPVSRSQSATGSVTPLVPRGEPADTGPRGLPRFDATPAMPGTEFPDRREGLDALEVAPDRTADWDLPDVAEAEGAPPAEPVARPGGGIAGQRRRSVWPLVVALVVIPVLIAGLVLAMWWQRNRAEETQLQQLLAGASSAIAEAQDLPDEDAARMRLVTARDFLNKAAVIDAKDSRLVDLETKYVEIANRVNHVTPLYGTVPLWEFKGEGHKLDRVVVNSNALYVLDRGRQEVTHFVLSELGDSVTPAEPHVVISKTQRVKDQVVGDLVDIAWADAVNNAHSRLLVLDGSGGLAAFDATWGADKVAIAGRERWGYPQLISAYNGNLYVVDTKANQIWRYRPGDLNYDNPPEPYFVEGTEVDLAGVQSIAIDGNIWLLYADGRLLKFFAGEHKAFEISGLTEPLSAPTAIVTSREGDQIYIADSGNGRIVELSKDGKFQRQFRPTQAVAFKEMRALFLDEGTSVFYVLVGDKLYKSDLPRQDAAGS